LTGVLLKSSANQGRKSIRTQSVTQACQAKRGAEENRYNLNICSYLKNIHSIFFLQLLYYLNVWHNIRD